MLAFILCYFKAILWGSGFTNHTEVWHLIISGVKRPPSQDFGLRPKILMTRVREPWLSISRRLPKAEMLAARNLFCVGPGVYFRG